MLIGSPKRISGLFFGLFSAPLFSQYATVSFPALEL
jgi:hypothetical protein